MFNPGLQELFKGSLAQLWQAATHYTSSHGCLEEGRRIETGLSTQDWSSHVTIFSGTFLKSFLRVIVAPTPHLIMQLDSWLIIWRLMSKRTTFLTHVALSFLPDSEVTLLSHALPRTEYKQATWFVVLTFRTKSNYFSRTCITFVVENFNSRTLNALGVPSLPVRLGSPLLGKLIVFTGSWC